MMDSFVTFGRLINGYCAILMFTARTKQNLVRTSTGTYMRICAHVYKPDLRTSCLSGAYRNCQIYRAFGGSPVSHIVTWISFGFKTGRYPGFL